MDELKNNFKKSRHSSALNLKWDKVPTLEAVGEYGETAKQI